jgi:hypothetical protein
MNILNSTEIAVSEVPYARIIFDRPTEKDAFAGKGHDRSARALSDGIRQVTDRGGAIGLEGPWGSGKSSVISIAEEHLNTADRSYAYHLFTFDLWTHQTDELRRALLEEFLTFIGDSDFKHEFNLAEERDAVRNRKKQVTSQSRPRYTLLGLSVLLLLPFVPIAYAWLNPVAFVNLAKLGFAPWFFLTVVALIVGWLPFLIWSAYDRVSLNERRNATSFVQRLVLAASEFLTISRNVKDETVTQWIRDEDPTTVEFNTVFDGLLTKAQAKNRRIVIVLDNVDRLPADLVRTAWSEIRALVARRPLTNDGAAIVVVPYDREYVLEAFSRASPTRDESASDSTTLDGGDRREDWRQQSDVFEKTFDRVVKVSPPVPSDWDKFLHDRLIESFGDQLVDADRETLFRLLKYQLQIEESHPTPRRIVAYVNDVGALWTQWGNVIPVGSIALYVLYRSLIDRNPASLVRLDIVASRFVHILNDSEWRKHLAALAFNVEPELANQVLLGQRIANAMVASTPDELVQLSKLPGFPQVFQEEFADALDELSQSDADALSRVANNVAQLTMSAASTALLWRDLKRRLPNLALSLTRQEAYSGLFLVIEHQAAADVLAAAADLREGFAKTIPGSDDESMLGLGQAWIAALRRIASACAKVGGAELAAAFWESSALPNLSYFTIGAAIAASEGGGALSLRTVKRSASDEEIRATLSNLVDAAPKVFERALPPLFEIAKSEAGHYASAIAERLKSADVAAEEARALLDSLIFMAIPDRSPGEVRTFLQPLATDGTLVWDAFFASDEDDGHVTAAALWLHIFVAGDVGVLPLKGLNSDLGDMESAAVWYNDLLTAGPLSQTQTDELANLIIESDQLGRWVEFALRDASTGQTFKNVLRTVVDRKGYELLDFGSVLKDYGGLRDTLGEARLREFLVELERSSKWLEPLLQSGNARLVPDQLVRDLKALDGKLTSVVLEYIDRYLKELTAEQWEAALQDPTSDELRLLAVRRTTGGPAMPVNSFLPAVVASAIATITDRYDPARAGEKWPAVVESVPKGSYSSRHRKIHKALS